MTASSTARKVNCRVAGWFICYPCPRKSNTLIAALGQVQCIRRRLAIRARTPYGTACGRRSEEHTTELQSLMRISYAVFCLKKKKQIQIPHYTIQQYKHQPMQ